MTDNRKKPTKRGEIELPNQVAKRTASVPFSKSIARVVKPAFQPKIRNVLVVPILPEPWSRKLI